MNNIDAIQLKNDCVNWIREFFEQNGKGCNAIIGISGGKDSSIAAALCVEALGKDRVIGILMPNGIQSDIDMAIKLCKHLDIKHYIVPIVIPVQKIEHEIIKNDILVSMQTQINLPARIRMATLYAFSQSLNGRVVNTCNLSEDYIGYSTRYGDAAGDFSPFANCPVRWVKLMGYAANLPVEFIEKIPSDGLCGKSDEENLGFPYEELDEYILTGRIENQEHKALIDKRHKNNLFKLQPMPSFNPFSNFLD